MNIALVAYPELSSNDYQWIENIRNKFGELKSEPIKPHFTLIFPISELGDDENIIRHIEQIAKKPIK